MAAPPRIPLHVGDYLKNTPAISRATWEHHGIYWLALMIAWNVPGVRLPDDITWLALRFGCTVEEAQDRVLPVIRTYFKLSHGFWYQKRLRKEHNFVTAQSELQRQRVNVRWNKNKSEYHGNTAEVPGQSRGNTTSRNTPTPTQETEKKEQGTSQNGGYARSRGVPPVGEALADDNLQKFMLRVARELDRISAGKGWAILSSATDANDPLHGRCLLMCKVAAKKIGKGWPFNWPKDHAIFDRIVANGSAIETPTEQGERM